LPKGKIDWSERASCFPRGGAYRKAVARVQAPVRAAAGGLRSQMQKAGMLLLTKKW